MQAGSNSKYNDLLKNWVFWLIVITGIAIIIRSIPAWTNAAWGCDFGIYYGLSKSFIESGGELYNPYTGWGSSYNYFPVLYAITGFAHWVTGIDILVIMTRLVPIFGGLSVLIFYFVVFEFTRDKKLAILSALFLAVLPFHVYQTSHASPLTLGHFFMMLCLYFFVKYRQRIWYIYPLFISTVLLIMSHHLTTYFYLICLLFIVFIENSGKNEWSLWLKKDIIYILFTSGLVFSYWAFIATPVFEGFMGRGISLGIFTVKSVFTVILFYVLFALIFVIIRLIRRYNSLIYRLKQKNKSRFVTFIIKILWIVNPLIKKEQNTVRKRIYLFLVTLLICYTIMFTFLVVKMPWTNFSFTPLSVVYSTPLLIVLAFGIAGIRDTWYIKNGAVIRGWFYALIASLLYASFTNNKTIFPHRHLEYIMAPLAVIAVLGINGIFLNLDYKKLSKQIRKKLHITKSKTRIIRKKPLLYTYLIAILLATNALSAYLAHESLGQSYEVITAEDISAVEWISENLDKNTSIITSDHRLERMMEAEGFNTTQDQAIAIWAEPVENKNEYISELFRVGENYTYNHITHVLIDDIMKNKMIHMVVSQREAINMTQESYEKFSPPFFELVHESKTVEIDPVLGEPVHWARVFKINWSYFWDNPGLKTLSD